MSVPGLKFTHSYLLVKVIASMNYWEGKDFYMIFR